MSVIEQIVGMAPALANAPVTRNLPIGLWGTSFTVGNAIQAVSTLLGGGLLAVVVRGTVIWQRDREATKIRQAEIELKADEAEAARDGSMRGDLWKMFTDYQRTSSERIAQLEKDAIEERRRCVLELSEMAQRHSGEMKSMQDRYDKELSAMRSLDVR